jgi:hypothetical protein
MCLPLLIIERLPLKLLLMILFFLSIMKSFTKRFHRGAVQSQRKLLRSRELESNLIHDNDTLRGVHMPPCLAACTLSHALRCTPLTPRVVLLRASRHDRDPSSCRPWVTSSSMLVSSFSSTSSIGGQQVDEHIL